MGNIMADLVSLGFKADSSGIVTAERNMNSLTVAGGRADGQLSTLSKTLGLVGAAITAVGATASAKQIVDYADSWSNVNTQLKQVTSNEGELLKVREQLLSVTRDTRSQLGNTVDLYAEMTRGTSELNISSDRLVGVTKTLNNLFLAGGKPISEASGAIRQLNQGFAAGALRGDEFNSVAEGAPKVLDALAASLSMSKGELREFAATGGITAEIMIKALEQYEETAQGLADTVKTTFAQNIQLANTNMLEFIGNADSVTGAVDALGGGIVTLSKNLDALADAGLAIAGVYGTALAIGIGKSAAATIADTVAKQANLAAMAKSTKATVTQTAAEVSLLKAQQSALAASIARIKSESISNTLRTQLTKTTAALSVAEQAHTKALISASTAQSAAAVSGRALGAAWRFMLGPWGLLIAAVGAGAATFLSTKDTIDEVTDSLSLQQRELARLTEIYDQMSKQDLESKRNALLAESNDLLFKRLDLEAQIATLTEKEAESNQRSGDARNQATNIYTAQLNAAKEALTALNGENTELDEKLTRIIASLERFNGENKEASSTSSKVNKELKKTAESFANQLVSLENQRQELILTNDEFEIYMAKQEAIANNYTPEMTRVIIEQTKALQDQRKEYAMFSNFEETMQAPDWISDSDFSEGMSDELKDLTDDVENFGGAWERTGNVIVDTFGGIADSITDYADRMEELGDLQSKITKEREKEGADLVELDKLQGKVNEEMMMAELDNYQSMAKAASSMFSEKTAAAKAFNAINQAMAIAEIAASLQKVMSSNAETATTVANEGIKQQALATTAIVSQGGGDPYTAFARIAAMTALMASIIGAVSGGGGSSYTPPDEGGTGTVLGDSSAQSNSISNSLDDFSDIQIDQLSELRGIRNSMSALSNGIEQLAVEFVRGVDFSNSGFSSSLGKTQSGAGIVNLAETLGLKDQLGIFGDNFIGPVLSSLFGSTKKKLVDSGLDFMTQTLGEIFDTGNLEAATYGVIEKTKKSFFGLSKKTSTSTEYGEIDQVITQQMADIFGYIGDSVVSSAESLGLDAKHIITTGLNSLSLGDALDGFQIDIGKISFKDKTGDEIQEELNAIFSQQADLITQYLAPSMAEYQKVGEGLFETLTRVTYEQAIFSDAIARMGKDVSSFSSEIQINIGQALVNLIGGAEEFAELTSSYFDEFYSDSEQLSNLKGSLNDIFEELGLPLSQSKEQFRDLVDSIDITTESGRELFAALLEINPAMADYLNALEDLAEDKLDLQIELLEALGESERALMASRKAELDQLDPTLRALQQQVWAQEDLNDAREAELEIMEKRSDMEIELLQAQGKEEEALFLTRQKQLEQLDPTLRGLQVQIWEQEALNEAREAESQLLLDNIAFAETQLENARQAEVSRLNAIVSGAQEAYSAQMEYINNQRSAYSTLISSLETNVSSAAAALESSRSAEIARINESKTARIASLQYEIDKIADAKAAYESMIDGLEQSVSNAGSALTDSLDAELSGFDSLTEAANNRYNSEVERINEASAARIAGLNKERSIIASVASTYGSASKVFSASDALQAARQGDFSKAGNIGSTDSYSNATDFMIAQARDAYALSEIGRLAENSLTDIDRQIAAAEFAADRQVAAAGEILESQLESIELEKQSLIEQVNAIMGVDDSVLSLADAISQYQDAERKLNQANSDGTLDMLDRQNANLELQMEQYETLAALQIGAINRQVDSVLGVDDSVMSIGDAIIAYQEAEMELSKEQSSGTLEALNAMEVAAEVALQQAQSSANAQIDALNEQVDSLLGIDSGVASVDESIGLLLAERKAYDKWGQNATIAQYEEQKKTNETLDKLVTAVIDKPINIIIEKPTDATQVNNPFEVTNQWDHNDRNTAKQIEKLREDLNNANKQIAVNTAKTASSVRKLEYLQSEK